MLSGRSMATTPVSQVGGVTGGIPRLETPSNVQRLLDENAQLIKCVSDDHNAGRMEEQHRKAQLLQPNLIYLAKFADQTLESELMEQQPGAQNGEQQQPQQQTQASSHGEPEVQQSAKKKRGRPRKRRFVNGSPSKESDTNGKVVARARSLSVRFKNGTGRDGSTAVSCFESMRVDGDDFQEDQCTQKATSIYSSIDSRDSLSLSPLFDCFSVNTLHSIPFEKDTLSVDRPQSIATLKSRVRQLEVERDTVCAQGKGYRYELARIIRIVNPEIDIESSMGSLLQDLEVILRSVDQTEEDLARHVRNEMSWKREVDQSLVILKAQEATLNEMRKKVKSELIERSDEINLLRKCFYDVSQRLTELSKNELLTFRKPFGECSYTEQRKRLSLLESEIERLVGKNADGPGREIEKLRIVSRMRQKLNPNKELMIEKWSTQEGMQLQCLQGWSDAQMERLRSILVHKNMNFLPSQKSMRVFRKMQWDANEWEVRYDEKGHIISEQCITIRKNLIEQLQRSELSGNLNRTEWGGNIGYCIVFDAGGGTTKVAGTVMNSVQPNSSDHIVLLGMYRGNDSYDEMSTHMNTVISQINDLIDHPEVKIITRDGNEEKVIVDLLITADYKAMCGMMGHGGPSSLYNCVICRRKAGRTVNTGQVLIGNQHRLQADLNAEIRDLAHYIDPSFSVHRSPLFKIPLSHIIPPALHMMMGLVKPFVSSLEDEMFQKDMDQMGYSSVSTVDEAKVKMTGVVDERDYNRDVVETLKREKEWIECSLTELRECEKWKESSRLGVGYCSQKCIMRGKSMKSLPTEYRETLECISCGKEMHLYCGGAVTMTSIEMVRMGERFRCYVCREETVESRIEERMELLEAINAEVEEYQAVILKCEHDLAKLNEVITHNSGPNRLRYEELLETLRISKQKYFNTFNGNDVKRMLKEGNVEKLMSLSSHPHKQEMEIGMKALGRIMGAAKARILSDYEIDRLKIDIDEYKQSMATCFPQFSVTPKCHLLLAHVIPFVQKWKTWGLASEQAIESLHATVNTIMRRFHNLKNEEHRWRLVTRELSMRRKLRDKHTIFE